MVDEKNEYSYDASFSDIVRGKAKKPLVNVVEHKFEKKHSALSIDDYYEDDPLGDLLSSLGIHFGTSDKDTKRMKKKIDEELDEEKDYLEKL